jgi:hypothetical protein
MIILRDAIRFQSGFIGALVRLDLAGLNKLIDEIQTQMALVPELKGSRYLVGSRTFKFAGGGTLFCAHLDSDGAANRFQGADLSHVLVDEAAQLADFSPILRMCSSLRTTRPDITPRLIITANPNNPGSHIIYQHIISKLTPWRPGYVEMFKREFVYVNSTLFDNPHITDREQYIETLKAACNHDEARIQSEVYGSWSSISGSFFGSVLDINRQRLLRLPTGLPTAAPDFDPFDVWLGLDFGTRAPSAVVLCFKARQAMEWSGRHIGAGSVVIVDAIHTNIKAPDGQELWSQGDRTLTTTKLARMVKEMCRRNGVSVDQLSKRHRVADAAIGAELGNKDGSIGNQLKDAGVHFIAAPKGRRPPGWTLMASMLEAAGDPSAPGLYCCENVDSFWATIPSLVYDPKNPEDLDSSGVDHLADSIRYTLMAMADPKYSYRTGPTNFAIYGAPEEPKKQHPLYVESRY